MANNSKEVSEMRRLIPLWIILSILLSFWGPIGCKANEPPNEVATSQVEEQEQQVNIELYIKENIQLGKREPRQGVYLGIYEGEGSNQKGYKSLEDSLGCHQVFEVMSYNLSSGLPEYAILRCIAENKIPYIKIAFDQQGDLGPLYRMITELKASYSLPVFVELFPIHQGVSDSLLYKQTYRRGYELLKKYLEDVVVVWSIDDGRIYDMPLYYPGDDVVDWAGLNIYIPRYRQGASYVFNRWADLDFWYKSFQKTKPMMISSLGISQFSRIDHTYDLRSVKNYLNKFYKDLPLSYPRIKGILYIDVDMAQIKEQGMDDYRLSTQEELIKHLRSLLKGPLFLQRIEEQVEGLRQGQYMKYSMTAKELGQELYLSKKVVTTFFKELSLGKCEVKLDLEGNKYYRLADIKAQTDLYYESKDQE